MAGTLVLDPLSPALPLPTIDGQLWTVRKCAQLRCCTGQHNQPRAPSPPDEGPPSHPQQMMGGSYPNHNTYKVGRNNLTLLLTGVVTSNLLNNTISSLLPTLHLW
jgi:hypothetical protein